MKFFKQYREYMEGHERDLPGVEFKHLKKILKHCRSEVDSEDELAHFDNHNPSNCPHHCPVCDGTFFPCLLKEMSEVVACFNDHVKELLHIHLATGLRKCFLFLTGKTKKDHGFMIQECQDLVTYALINAIAVRKILKKYDKIHYSKQGQAFKSQAQRMRIEILQSPWLCELMAFHVNLREENIKKQMGGAALFDGCSLTFFDGKPALTCEIFDAMRVDIDLRCAICLDTVFDPVSLTCGHIFCYICACSAASVTIVDGLKSAAPHNKCPKCREAAVYEGAVRLTELNMLLKRRCREYWEERLQSERQERLRLAKEHYVMQHRSFVGF